MDYGGLCHHPGGGGGGDTNMCHAQCCMHKGDYRSDMWNHQVASSKTSCGTTHLICGHLLHNTEHEIDRFILVWAPYAAGHMNVKIRCWVAAADVPNIAHAQRVAGFGSNAYSLVAHALAAQPHVASCRTSNYSISCRRLSQGCKDWLARTRKQQKKS